MRPVTAASSVLVALCLVASRGLALTHPDDMCSQPTMKTDKWMPRPEVGGMTILMPPGFVMMAGDNQDRIYANGEHRSITVGEGSGAALQHIYRDISETGECETVISGRRVTITLYQWVVEDAVLSASGHAGPHFAAVARYYASGALREVYVQLMSSSKPDLKYFRQLFWTVSFAGAPVTADVIAPGGTAVVAAAPVAATATSATATLVASPACAPTPHLPTPDGVLDSSMVAMLIASAAPIPHGYEVMALQFGGTGELTGMSVAKSDLPEASQHELSSVIASNLKPHYAQEPSTYLLRIDSGDSGLHYAVLPISSCTH